MGCAALVKVDTPYAEEELFDVGYEQAADVVIFTHRNHPVQRLLRYDVDVWVFEPAIFATQTPPPANLAGTANTPNTVSPFPRDINYVVTAINDVRGEESLISNVETVNIDLSLRGNTVDLTWDAVSGCSSFNVYKGYTSTYGFIGRAGVDRAFVDDNILPDYSDGPPQHRNPFDASGDYPAVVTFWQQRAFYARTLNRPNAMWGSQSSLFFDLNVSVPVTDSDAIAVALAGKRVNAILHMVPIKDLLVFTTDAIWSIKGGDAVTPTNIDPVPHSYRGCSKLRPIAIDEVVFYTESRGAAVRTVNFDWEVDGYRGNDLTVFSPHLFKGVTIVDWAWAAYPTQTLYAVGSDGKVRCMTWQPEQQVWGWSLMTMDALGFVESVCVISENGEDVPYFVVRRTVKLQPPATPEVRRYVERASSYLWADVADAIYLDCASVYNDPLVAEDTFTNLSHLEGRLVFALVDGAVCKSNKDGTALWVKRGRITLPKAGNKVIIGIPFTAWARTLPLAGRNPQSIGQAVVSVIRTRGLEVGIGQDKRGVLPIDVTDADEVQEDYVVKGRGREAPGLIPQLLTGDYEVDIPPGKNPRTPSITFRQRDPLPMHIAGVTFEGQAGGDALA